MKGRGGEGRKGWQKKRLTNMPAAVSTFSASLDVSLSIDLFLRKEIPLLAIDELRRPRNLISVVSTRLRIARTAEGIPV